ncbi:MAG: Ribosome-associated factor Y [Tenericutes bacterium ADurb.Bin239]|jgi:putative sigma-54 modulation protein|nr:MAG: Ribosome-associated factor Y [Tenericutes bacterium ADurb.Bin239]
MKYQIVGKNIVVTDAIRNALEKKLSRMDKYFVIGDDIDCRAVVSKIRSTAKVEVTIFTKHMIFRAEETDPDLYSAFDKAIDSLEGQMRKLKTRLSRRNRVGLGEAIAQAIAFDNIEGEAVDESEHKVVRLKSIYLEPMSLEDAIMRMEALSHKFFLYLDAEDNLISLLYIRNDGGYGIIQAENKIK